MHPLIGITTYGLNAAKQFHLYANYLEAVRLAGGIPVLLTPGEAHPSDLLERLDGLVFTGGGDVAPECFGGEQHSTIYSVDTARDRFELTLAERVLDTDIPTLGICRGLQVLNIASQGDILIPHVPDVFTAMRHRVEPPDPQTRASPTEHPVIVKAGSRLASIVQAEEISVVSWHHQAIKTVPPQWQMVAQAPDGLIEAIEHIHHPWMVALQWHPEMSIADGYQIKVFQAFVRAAQQHRSNTLSTHHGYIS